MYWDRASFIRLSVHNETPSVGWAQVAKEQKKRENRAKQRHWGKSRKAFTTKMTYVRELS